MAVATLPKVRGQKTDWATPEYGVCPWPSRRFTVDEYHRLDELEIFHPDEKCELLYGWIMAKDPGEPAWERDGDPEEEPLWPYPIRKFTVEEYESMIGAGFFDANPKFELLDGWITPKMAIDPSHSRTVRLLTACFNRRLADGWIVSVQQPVRTGRSEPEPDLAILPGTEDDYDGRHPNASEAAIVVEVGNSSLDRDRELKLPIYASARVVQYWIVNIIDHRVEVYTQPRGGKKPGYKSCVHYAKGDEIPLVLAKKKVGSLPVSEFLA